MPDEAICVALRDMLSAQQAASTDTCKRNQYILRQRGVRDTLNALPPFCAVTFTCQKEEVHPGGAQQHDSGQTA